MNQFNLSHQLNKFKLRFSKFFKLTSSLGYPDCLQIEPTNFCNARCPLCPTGVDQLRRPKGFIDYKLFKKIIDEVAGKTSNTTLFNYGESFLHPKIFQMIDYAKDRDLSVCVSTNGYVFYKKSNIRKLVESNLDILVVSLDGATKKTFSIYRKNVDYHKFITGLKLLKALKKRKDSKTPKVIIQFIVMKHNQHELTKIKKMIHAFGDELQIKTVNTQMVSGILPSDWLPTKNTYSRYIKDSQGDCIPKKQNYYNCPFIWHSLVINWDGSVNPCCYDYQGDVILGNVKNETISDIWTGKKMKKFRESILRDRRQNKICVSCPVDLYKEKMIVLPD